MYKERLDVLIVKRNLIETREKAKRMIMAGLVFSDTERLDKPGMRVNSDIPITVKGTLKYVSRGGFKLERALKVFEINVQDKVIVDIGDRKSTRLNSSHVAISYAVFCLKQKRTEPRPAGDRHGLADG